LWYFGIFFPFWYIWTEKNLAALSHERAAENKSRELLVKFSLCRNLKKATMKNGYGSKRRRGWGVAAEAQPQ
jgi:hypothetical protein